jgi:UDP-N-acetylglucosamine--N-acetylmuramyl-(pentapeptide) pyrophosphoryl-undecaprenol N-acetylglucosamine transferase
LTKILYAVSPIGLGHASRAVAVCSKLRARGHDLELVSGGGAASFLRSYGFGVHDIVTEPTPDAFDGVMKRPGLWYWRYWSGYRHTKEMMLGLIELTAPDIVIGDEEFSSVSLAIEKGMDHALISDELELGFANGILSRVIERRVSRWYANLQQSVAHLLIPDFGTDMGNMHFMSPVVREVTMPRDQVLAKLGLSPNASFILFSASGSGIGQFLLEPMLRSFRELNLTDTSLVVTGLAKRSGDGGVICLGVERDNQNLVAAADLVVSTAGKSTIDEAKSYGSPIIVIPIKNHSEQERNARALGFSHQDMARMSMMIKEHIGRRTEPRNYSGAENIAEYISGMVSSKGVGPQRSAK